MKRNQNLQAHSVFDKDPSTSGFFVIISVNAFGISKLNKNQDTVR